MVAEIELDQREEFDLLIVSNPPLLKPIQLHVSADEAPGAKQNVNSSGPYRLTKELNLNWSDAYLPQILPRSIKIYAEAYGTSGLAYTSDTYNLALSKRAEDNIGPFICECVTEILQRNYPVFREILINSFSARRGERIDFVKSFVEEIRTKDIFGDYQFPDVEGWDYLGYNSGVARGNVLALLLAVLFKAVGMDLMLGFRERSCAMICLSRLDRNPLNKLSSNVDEIEGCCDIMLDPDMVLNLGNDIDSVVQYIDKSKLGDIRYVQGLASYGETLLASGDSLDMVALANFILNNAEEYLGRIGAEMFEESEEAQAALDITDYADAYSCETAETDQNAVLSFGSCIPLTHMGSRFTRRIPWMLRRGDVFCLEFTGSNRQSTSCGELIADAVFRDAILKAVLDNDGVFDLAYGQIEWTDAAGQPKRSVLYTVPIGIFYEDGRFYLTAKLPRLHISRYVYLAIQRTSNLKPMFLDNLESTDCLDPQDFVKFMPAGVNFVEGLYLYYHSDYSFPHPSEIINGEFAGELFLQDLLKPTGIVPEIKWRKEQSSDVSDLLDSGQQMVFNALLDEKSLIWINDNRTVFYDNLSNVLLALMIRNKSVLFVSDDPDIHAEIAKRLERAGAGSQFINISQRTLTLLRLREQLSEISSRFNGKNSTVQNYLPIEEAKDYITALFGRVDALGKSQYELMLEHLQLLESNPLQSDTFAPFMEDLRRFTYRNGSVRGLFERLRKFNPTHMQYINCMKEDVDGIDVEFLRGVISAIRTKMEYLGQFIKNGFLSTKLSDFEIMVKSLAYLKLYGRDLNSALIYRDSGYSTMKQFQRKAKKFWIDMLLGKDGMNYFEDMIEISNHFEEMMQDIDFTDSFPYREFPMMFKRLAMDYYAVLRKSMPTPVTNLHMSSGMEKIKNKLSISAKADPAEIMPKIADLHKHLEEVFRITSTNLKNIEFDPDKILEFERNHGNVLKIFETKGGYEELIRLPDLIGTITFEIRSRLMKEYDSETEYAAPLNSAPLDEIIGRLNILKTSPSYRLFFHSDPLSSLESWCNGLRLAIEDYNVSIEDCRIFWDNDVFAEYSTIVTDRSNLRKDGFLRKNVHKQLVKNHALFDNKWDVGSHAKEKLIIEVIENKKQIRTFFSSVEDILDELDTSVNRQFTVYGTVDETLDKIRQYGDLWKSTDGRVSEYVRAIQEQKESIDTLLDSLNLEKELLNQVNISELNEIVNAIRSEIDSNTRLYSVKKDIIGMLKEVLDWCDNCLSTIDNSEKQLNEIVRNIGYSRTCFDTCQAIFTNGAGAVLDAYTSLLEAFDSLSVYLNIRYEPSNTTWKAIYADYELVMELCEEVMALPALHHYLTSNLGNDFTSVLWNLISDGHIEDAIRAISSDLRGDMYKCSPVHVMNKDFKHNLELDESLLISDSEESAAQMKLDDALGALSERCSRISKSVGIKEYISQRLKDRLETKKSLLCKLFSFSESLIPCVISDFHSVSDYMNGSHPFDYVIVAAPNDVSLSIASPALAKGDTKLIMVNDAKPSRVLKYPNKYAERCGGLIEHCLEHLPVFRSEECELDNSDYAGSESGMDVPAADYFTESVKNALDSAGYLVVVGIKIGELYPDLTVFDSKNPGIPAIALILDSSYMHLIGDNGKDFVRVVKALNAKGVATIHLRIVDWISNRDAVLSHIAALLN